MGVGHEPWILPAASYNLGVRRGRVNDRFAAAVDAVGLAKAALTSAAPRRRSAGVPLAEALAGFEAHLRDARDRVARMDWSPDDEGRSACLGAIDASLAVAAWLRLEGEPEGYEALYPILDDAMRPLEVFDAVLRRRG